MKIPTVLAGPACAILSPAGDSDGLGALPLLTEQKLDLVCAAHVCGPGLRETSRAQNPRPFSEILGTGSILRGFCQ